jgi:hypothetical protein
VGKAQGAPLGIFVTEQFLYRDIWPADSNRDRNLTVPIATIQLSKLRTG